MQVNFQKQTNASAVSRLNGAWASLALCLSLAAPAAAQDNPEAQPIRLAFAPLPFDDSLARPIQRTEMQAIEADPDGIFVGSIIVQSDGDLNAANFSEIVESNIGKELQEDDLRKITQQVAAAARDAGYPFANAKIPEQGVMLGVLQVELDQGRIDDIRIIGSDSQALQRQLAPLKGAIAKKEDIEHALVLAGDIPQIGIKRTRLLRENGNRILEVQVIERKNKFRAEIDNYGTKSIGPMRAKLSFDYSGVLSDSDRGSISVRTNPIDPKEFVYVNGRYSVGVGNKGTRLSVAASAGKTEAGDFGNGNTEGDSRYIRISASHPLRRSADASLWLNAGAALLEVKRDDALGLLLEDRHVTFSVGLASNNKLLGGRLRMGATLMQGADLFNATRLGDPLSSRLDGDGVFTKGYFYADWRGQLSGDLGLHLAARGQIANRALLATQQFSIGGASSVRGYDFAERSGDNGFAALAELHYTIKNPAKWIQQIQPYAFIDGGYVDNLSGGFGGGTLLSSGAGLRADIGKLNFEIEGAVPLNQIRFESGDKSPQVNIRLGLELD